MTNQSPAPQELQALAISNQINLRERLDHLLKDPSSTLEEIKAIGTLLSQTVRDYIKSLTRVRELALAERRLEDRREARALQTNVTLDPLKTNVTLDPLKTNVTLDPLKTSVRLVPATNVTLDPLNVTVPPASVTQEPAACLIGSRVTMAETPISETTAAPAPVIALKDEPPAVSIASAAAQKSTSELQAMEWDLRTTFAFGDLRPFEFSTGTQMIRFPDRTAHPEAAKPNYPIQFNNPPDFVKRMDEFVVLPHVLPAGFAKAETKSKADSKPKLPGRQRAELRLKDGVIDWASFVQPLSTGVWPHNTVLPATWQYGDPIPGQGDVAPA